MGTPLSRTPNVSPRPPAGRASWIHGTGWSGSGTYVNPSTGGICTSSPARGSGVTTGRSGASTVAGGAVVTATAVAVGAGVAALVATAAGFVGAGGDASPASPPSPPAHAAAD